MASLGARPCIVEVRGVGPRILCGHVRIFEQHVLDSVVSMLAVHCLSHLECLVVHIVTHDASGITSCTKLHALLCLILHLASIHIQEFIIYRREY